MFYLIQGKAAEKTKSRWKAAEEFERIGCSTISLFRAADSKSEL